jgi:hypothetical protein
LAAADRRGVLRAALAQLGADLRQVGLAHLDEIVRRTDPDARTAASGPHPLPGGLAWSVISAGAGLPARLCLHAATAPPAAAPAAARGPQLDAAWRQAHAAVPLPVPGELAAGAWRLRATPLPAAQLPADWRAQCGPWRLYADAAALTAAALTTPAPGMRFAPLGMGGQHRRVVEVLAGRKLPRSLREGWPLLVDCRSGQVLWVCGVQPAEPLRITPQTPAAVLLEWLAA